ncbi:MAG: threonine synthase [Clostridia bacterium]|nr:threonine synthase [Clostridia bacterium]
MNYYSTRDTSVRISAAEAVKMGLSRDGGLLTPEAIPQIDEAFICSLVNERYQVRAAKVMGLYLTDYSEEELLAFAENAYGPDKFDTEAVAPVRKVDDITHCLELWHGPTSAFKDMALQMLPQLLSAALRKTGEDKTVCILVATSGDTGKAAMEGFADVPQTKIMVFYPKNGVSAVQEAQMVTQEGENVGVCAVVGNFDDAQSGVKKIFTDKAIAEKLAANGMAFSSANSINWGRLVPQIVYYFSAYCDLVAAGEIKAGDKINVVVPTGNFGNILAAYYAKEMGLPVKKFICASNSNSVLTEFLTTGVYNKNREFFTTISPSMDILISSNLERLLYTISGSENVCDWMKALSEEGRYEVDAATLAKIKADFDAGCCNDEETKATIAKVFGEKNYLCDTHTAVAVKSYYDYKARTSDNTPAVIASTASPFKFSAAVLDAVSGATDGLDEFEMVEKLADDTKKCCPEQLANLREKEVRFTGCCSKDSMEQVVFDMLGI